MKAKLFKILKYFGIILIILLLGIGVLISTDWFQNVVADKAASYFSKEIGTTITIDKVKINWDGSVDIDHVYIADKHEDTMFYIAKINASYGLFNNETHIVQLSDLAIKDVVVNFRQYKGEDDFNYEFFIKYFAPKKKRVGPPVIWSIIFDKLKLENGSFRYEAKGKEAPNDRIFNENHMYYHSIYADFDNFQIIDDSLDFNIKFAKLKEHSGLIVQELISKTTIHAKGMTFDEMNLVTENSTLKEKLHFQYDNWKSFSGFITDVYMVAELKESKVSTKDIALFTNTLKSYDYLVDISGLANGTIASFDAEEVNIKTLNNTYLKGNFSLSGLPDFKNTFMDFSISSLKTNQWDIQKLAGRGSLPENIKKLGNITYKGNLTGFSKDFVSYGTLSTELGSLTTDINLKLNEDFTDGSYSGLLKTENFALGEFLDEDKLGTLAVNAKVIGSGFKKNNVNLKLEGSMDRIEFLGYPYIVKKVEGTLNPTIFTGLAIVKDTNIDLTFNGKVDFSNKEPVLNFYAKVTHANLEKLHLDSSTHFAANMKLNMTGFDLDKFYGTAVVDSIEYKRNNLPLQKVEFINLNANSSGNQRNLILTSDIINAEIRGQFIFKEMVHTAEEILHELLPLYFGDEYVTTVSQDFNFRIDLLKPEILTKLFAPEVILSKGWVKGELKSENNQLNIKLKNNALGYQGNYLRGLDISASKEPKKPMYFNVKATDLMLDSMVFTSEVSFEGNVFNNAINYQLDAKEKENKHAISTQGLLAFDSTKIDLHIGKSDISVLEEKWYLDSQAYVSYEDEVLTVERLVLENNNQYIEANGTIGEASNNRLKITTKRFDLSTLNNFTPSEDIEVFGLANGDIDVTNLYSTPYITTDLKIQNLAINKDTIGNLSLFSKFINNNKSLDMQAKVESGLLNGLLISGLLHPFQEKNNFEIDLKMPESNISVLENFTKGFVSEIEGNAKANLKLRGDFEKPQITGKVDLVNTKVKVDYLNTYFKVNTTVNVAPDGFYFERFKIYDNREQSGWVSGNIKHSNYSDFYLDISVSDLKNFMVLNTNKLDNDLYYGTAIIDGNARVTGPISSGVDLYINATTKKGTNFHLPIDDGEGVASSSFITFKKEKSKGPVIIDSGIPGINYLQINASITEDAEIEIIFDEQLGDKISGTGSGNLAMILDDVGDFYLKGTYTIKQGRYLFTALDVINKQFFIDQGSKIEWTGDPLNAQVDISASFLQTASTKNLITSTAKDENNETIYTDVLVKNYLYLKGSLFSPDISFDLELPTVNGLSSNNSEVISVINRIKNDPEELNRQVFSLLVFGQFLPPSFATVAESSFDASSGISTSVSDLISNQVGNWLSAIDDKWKVNVDFRTGTSAQREEFILGLGRKFINDRLEVNASYNSAQTTTPNFDVQYALTKDGRLKIKAYSKSSVNIASNSNSTTQGVGFYFRKEFDRRRKRRLERNKMKAIEANKLP